ncbi:MAG TPA: hypothetical protein PLJ34_06540 [Hyphomicrobiales bacterium]|nr:hypothetical protein [Hyphomicrobiales bacterium]
MVDRKPVIIVAAGMPRSGSTWLFNAARLLLEAAGKPAHAAWVEDYDPADPAGHHLVKVHFESHLTFEPDVTLTTWRPFEECLASLVRMRWLDTDAEAIRSRYRHQKDVYDHWAARTDCEIDFADIVGAPEAAIAGIAEALAVPADAAARRRIAAALAALAAPESGPYDKTTLLHPGHRATDPDDCPMSPAEVRAIIADLL